MLPEFQALYDYVLSIKPGEHIIMFSRKEVATVAKTRSRWGSQQLYGGGKFDVIDHLYLPAKETLTNLLPTTKSLLIERYGQPLEQGRRTIFISKNIVVKMPFNIRGLIDNFSEARLYSAKDDPNLARCKLCLVNQMPVLAMEKIDTDPNHPNSPDWVSVLDRRQAGLNKWGQWKAYDYGLV